MSCQRTRNPPNDFVIVVTVETSIQHYTLISKPGHQFIAKMETIFNLSTNYPFLSCYIIMISHCIYIKKESRFWSCPMFNFLTDQPWTSPISRIHIISFSFSLLWAMPGLLSRLLNDVWCAGLARSHCSTKQERTEQTWGTVTLLSTDRQLSVALVLYFLCLLFLAVRFPFTGSTRLLPILLSLLLLLLFYLKGRITQREGETHTDRSSIHTPLASGAEQIQIWEARASSRSSRWVPGPEDLSHALLLSWAISKELDRKWSWDTGMLTLQEEDQCDTSPCHPHLFSHF